MTENQLRVEYGEMMEWRDDACKCYFGEDGSNPACPRHGIVSAFVPQNSLRDWMNSRDWAPENYKEVFANEYTNIKCAGVSGELNNSISLD